MSFEGFYQLICEEGHRTGCDCYELCLACHICGKAVIFQNLVDQTNGNEVGYITEEGFKTLIKKEAVTETCSHCGHTKQEEPELYRIPTKEELESLRTINYGNGPVPFNAHYHQED
jgi:hypothetical protein